MINQWTMMELFFPHHFQVPNPAVTVSSNHARLVSFLETGISSLINCDELSLADQVASGRLQLRPQSTVLLGDKKIWGLVKTCILHIYMIIYMHMYIYIYVCIIPCFGEMNIHLSSFVSYFEVFTEGDSQMTPASCHFVPLEPALPVEPTRISHKFTHLHLFGQSETWLQDITR